MKTNFKLTLLIAFFALFSFNSCIDEATDFEQFNEQEIIAPNSTLSNLMQSASANDGAQDDILDDANCLSVNLPVTIVVNGITITINTLDDLELIEELFNEFNTDEDILEFLFPITITLNDYTEFVINNIGELEEFIEQCTNSVDDVIECIDFQYPISISIFNAEFDIIDTVIIENDEALYAFIESLEDNPNGAIIASLNFPVTLVYANGETIEVNSNQELSEAINAAEEECDDDDEEDDCTVEHVDMYLQECSWEIATYNGDDNFENLSLFFNEEGVLEILNGSTTQFIDGNWSTSLTDEGVILSISEVTEFDGALNGDWLIVDCDDDRFVLVQETPGTNNAVEMVIEQECEDDIDCSAQEVSMYLQECIWYAGTNLYDNVVIESFEFTEDGIVIITNPISNESITGTWNVSLTDEGVFVSLDLPEPYDVISLIWLVTDCDDDRVFMEHENDYLVFERDCENDDYDCEDRQANFGDDCEDANGNIGYINEDCGCEVEDTNPFECFEEDAVLEECFVDTFTTFNLTEAFPNCALPATYAMSYHETLTDAESGTNAISNPESYQNINTFEQTIYLAIMEISTQEIEVFEIHLIAEDCSNPSNCTDNGIRLFLIECTWNVVNFNGSDDLIIFDFDFNNDGTVTITGDGTTITAMWSTSNTANGVIVEFQNVNAGNIQAITGNWLVVECAENRLELIKENDEMVLEQDCN